MVRAARWKARGRWFDSRRKHIFSFWTLRFPFLTARRKPYINEIKHDIHPELWLHRDRFKTRKIWRRFILQHISFHKKIANHFWTDGQWQKIGKTLIHQIFFYKKCHIHILESKIGIFIYWCIYCDIRLSWYQHQASLSTRSNKRFLIERINRNSNI